MFFLQNNHWAISVPVERQSRTPLYLRSTGFGIPSVQIDGNDVLASYAVTAQSLDDARSGKGPALHRGAHLPHGRAHLERRPDEVPRCTTSSTFWSERDPIARFETFLRAKGAGDDFFAEVATEAEDLAADVRARTVALGVPAGIQDVRPRLHRPAPADRRAGGLARRLRGVVRRGERTSADRELERIRRRSASIEHLTLAKAINSGCRRPWPTTPRSC